MVELPRSVPTYKVTDFCASALSPLRLSLVSGVLLCFTTNSSRKTCVIDLVLAHIEFTK